MFIILLIALALTFSRSSYLAFLVAGFIFAFIADRRIILIGIITAGLLFTVSERAQERVIDAVNSAQALFMETEKTMDPTSRLRVESWNVGIKLFEKNPLTGIGFNTLKVVQKQEWADMYKSHAGSGIDSSLLTVLSTTGIVGLLSYLWILTIILRKSINNYFLTKNYYYLGFFAGFIGILVHSLFVNTLFLNLLLPTLLLSASLTIRTCKK